MSYIRVNKNCHNSSPKCIGSGEGRKKKMDFGGNLLSHAGNNFFEHPDITLLKTRR